MSAEEFDRIVAQVGGIDLYLSAVRSWSLVILTSLALAIEPLRVVEAEGDPTLRVMLLDKEYQRLLFDAAESRSFELTRQYIIRKLSDNPALHELPAEPPKQPDLSPGLRLSFRRTYVGAAVDGLYNYLVKCDAEFREPGSNFYGRFLSIVQSSGTGKSRTISRLMQTRALGLYMNIRPVEDTNSYPGRDKIPAAILAGNLECTPEEYANRCVSFFTSIFTAIREELIEEGDGAVSEGTVMKWSREMSCMESPRRGRFFKRVKEKYDQMMANFQKDDGSAPIGTEGRDDKSSKEVTNFQVQAHDAELLKVITGGMESLESGLVDLSIDNGKTARSTSRVQPAPKMGKSSSEESDVIAIPELRGEPLMLVAYEELIAVAPEFFDEASSTPKLVIAIDEAHKLGKQLGGYTPSHILCRVISRFTKSNDTANWVIFASTLAKVADFSAPAHMHPSSRIRRGGEALFAPYSQLDWDQLATPLKEIKLQEVAQLGNIVGFGRPLWKTLLTSDPSMTNLLKTAGWKLCHNTHFDPSDSAQVFAVLGQRFCLDICFGHTKAVELQSKAVSSHLRFCLRTTPDRLWRTTSYPSEPILSCAAARFLFWTSTGHIGANLVQSLQSLWMDIEGGVVDIGKKGELVSRLVYLLAKDIFVRGPGFPAAPKNSRSTNNELLDCRMVPVVDYLEFVFGPSAAAEHVKNVFRGWYINFSHWVSMSAVIKTDDSTGLKTWLTRHWIRTCAIQCCHNQRGIDKLIPMYKKPNSGDPYDGRMSYILISDRARKTSSKRDLEEVSPDGAGIHDLHQPYIAILADLRRNGSKPEFELDAANPTPSLRAYAPGVNPTTYPFLADYGLHKAQETLRMMLDPPQGNSEPGMALLENHAKYGETMDASTLEWEVGREERS